MDEEARRRLDLLGFWAHRTLASGDRTRRDSIPTLWPWLAAVLQGCDRTRGGPHRTMWRSWSEAVGGRGLMGAARVGRRCGARQGLGPDALPVACSLIGRWVRPGSRRPHPAQRQAGCSTARPELKAEHPNEEAEDPSALPPVLRAAGAPLRGDPGGGHRGRGAATPSPASTRPARPVRLGPRRRRPPAGALSGDGPE